MNDANLQTFSLHLDTDLLGDPVHRGFTCTVRHTRHGLLLDNGYATHRACDQDELGLATSSSLLLEKWPGGLEESDRRNGIDLEVGAENGRINAQGIVLETAGAGTRIGDDNINTRDTCASKKFRQGRGGRDLRRVKWEENETAVGVRWQSGEGLGGGVGDVPSRRDNCRGGTEK